MLVEKVKPSRVQAEVLGHQVIVDLVVLSVPLNQPMNVVSIDVIDPH